MTIRDRTPYPTLGYLDAPVLGARRKRPLTLLVFGLGVLVGSAIGFCTAVALIG